ncbi:hypothetical protein GJ496_001041, partial [Pomphorhynchus laevis]
SIGAAKSALEVMNGFNLYGREYQSSRSVVYVDIDAYNRNRITLNTMLPRESSSKNTDAALLFTISWPVFTTHECNLISKTMNKCKRKLEGNYGFKRYLRDGRFTSVEDRTREFYTMTEMKMFDGIECQWPIFFAQMIIDAIYRDDKETEEKYFKKLKEFLETSKYDDNLPLCYIVPSDMVQRAQSHSEDVLMVPSDELSENRPSLFTQSIWIIAQLLHDRLLHKGEFDILKKHLKSIERPIQHSRYSSIQGYCSDLIIHVIAISESARLQQLLLTYGIVTQTPNQIEPIKIWSHLELVRAYSYLGVNGKLKFSGRPSRPIGVLGTCKVYRISSQMVICYPITFETIEFYISHDLSLLLDNVRVCYSKS